MTHVWLELPNPVTGEAYVIGAYKSVTDAEWAMGVHPGTISAFFYRGSCTSLANGVIPHKGEPPETEEVQVQSVKF